MHFGICYALQLTNAWVITVIIIIITNKVIISWWYLQLSVDQFGEVRIPSSTLTHVEEVDEENAEDDEQSADAEQHWAGDLERIFADLRRARPVRDDRHRYTDEHHPDGNHDEENGERVASRRHRPSLHASHLRGLCHSLMILEAHGLRTIVLGSSG